MASRLFLFLSLCLMCSCTSQHTSFARYHENGKMKPTVLVGSIEDLSDSGLSWNISQELQQEIKKSFLSNLAGFFAFFYYWIGPISLIAYIYAFF